MGTRRCKVDCIEEPEPAVAHVCPVGYPEVGRAFDDDPVHGDLGPPTGHDLAHADEPVRLVTEMRGCACTKEEQEAGDCVERPDLCPHEGRRSGRWSQATFPGQPWGPLPGCGPDGGWCPYVRQHPTYDYRRLYAGEPDPLAHVDRWDRYKTSFGPYAWWYAAGDPLLIDQTWNYITDNARIRGPDGAVLFPPDVKRHAWLWFRPRPNNGFAGVRNEFGNTYVTRRMGATPFTMEVGDDGGEITAVGGGRLPCMDLRECGSIIDIWDLAVMEHLSFAVPFVGPLDWTFDGAWREVGSLPGADGGLADAGGAAVGDDIWLFGGRQAGGPSAVLWRIDRRTGQAERITPHSSPWPGARIRPAMAYDSATGELLIFGGVDAYGAGFTDVWAYHIASGAWRLAVPTCAGSGCPVATGGDKIVPLGAPGELAVVADPFGAAAGHSSWTIQNGTWTRWLERIDLPMVRDCDRDGAVDPAWGARCGAGSEGFPSYGRLRCETSSLSCRSPVKPGTALGEYVMPGTTAFTARLGTVAVLKDRDIEFYRLLPGGALESDRAIHLSRRGTDLALAGNHVLVADREGMTVYSLEDGAEVAAAPTCGRARRLFVEGGRAYLIGLRSLLVVDVSDPGAPEVIHDYRISASRAGATLSEPGYCPWVYAAADFLCDVT